VSADERCVGGLHASTVLAKLTLDAMASYVAVGLHPLPCSTQYSIPGSHGCTADAGAGYIGGTQGDLCRAAVRRVLASRLLLCHPRLQIEFCGSPTRSASIRMHCQRLAGP
jgi:hypothetical protein